MDANGAPVAPDDIAAQARQVLDLLQQGRDFEEVGRQFATDPYYGVLTGETKILRTDLMYDMGWSINPALDIGQVAPVIGSFHGTSSDLLKMDVDVSVRDA